MPRVRIMPAMSPVPMVLVPALGGMVIVDHIVVYMRFVRGVVVVGMRVMCGVVVVMIVAPVIVGVARTLHGMIVVFVSVRGRHVRLPLNLAMPPGWAHICPDYTPQGYMVNNPRVE